MTVFKGEQYLNKSTASLSLKIIGHHLPQYNHFQNLTPKFYNLKTG